MAASFLGDIEIKGEPDNWRAVVSGKGADSGSGSRASGSMTYSLASGASAASTRVDIVSDINLAGALAQFSKGPIVQEIANRITAAFVANFESKLAAASPAPELASSSAPVVQEPQSFDAGGLIWAVMRDRFREFFRGLFGRSSARS
jgi:hypothetical protein